MAQRKAKSEADKSIPEMAGDVAREEDFIEPLITPMS